MALSKPNWLTWFLDRLNIDRGEWLDVSFSIPFGPTIGLVVPPFSLSLGDWIETAVDGVIEVVGAGLDAITAIMATTVDIYQAGLNLAENIGQVIQSTAAQIWDGVNALSDRVDQVISGVYDAIGSALESARQESADLVAGAVSGLWDRVADYVQGAIDAAFDAVREQINIVAAFGDEIQEFFTDPEEYIINKLEAALDRFW